MPSTLQAKVVKYLLGAGADMHYELKGVRPVCLCGKSALQLAECNDSKDENMQVIINLLYGKSQDENNRQCFNDNVRNNSSYCGLA